MCVCISHNYVSFIYRAKSLWYDDLLMELTSDNEGMGVGVRRIWGQCNIERVLTIVIHKINSEQINLK